MEKPLNETNSFDGHSVKKRKFSDDNEETDDDDRSSDDLMPPLPTVSIYQKFCTAALPRSTVSVAGVSDTTASGFSLVDKSASNNPRPYYAMTRSCDLNGGLVHGVKRKFLGSHYETKRRKRLKTHHYKTTVQNGLKKRHKAPYNPDQDRKRLKTIPEESEGFVSRPIYSTQTGNTSDDRNTVSGLGPAGKSDETSPSSSIEDEEDTDEVQLCPNFCVCRVGHSDLPPPVERKFDTSAPLYKACLLRRIYSLNNTQYMCCRKRCVTKLSRERVLKECLFHMNEDYYNNDLRMQQYSWGEWKE